MRNIFRAFLIDESVYSSVSLKDEDGSDLSCQQGSGATRGSFRFGPRGDSPVDPGLLHCWGVSGSRAEASPGLASSARWCCKRVGYQSAAPTLVGSSQRSVDIAFAAAMAEGFMNQVVPDRTAQCGSHEEQVV